MSEPLISVIVPNYNHARFLEQRLESIFNQSYQHIEVILLDDCSTDTSQSILLEYSKHPKVSHCLFNETNSGSPFKQWQKGIELAQGDYIWIAESDDYCEIDFLETVAAPLIANQDVVLSYCQSNRVNEKGEVTGTWKDYTDPFKTTLFDTDFIAEGNTYIQQHLIYKNIIPNASAVLIRKSKILVLGLDEVNSNLKYCGDWLFYYKLLLGSKVAFSSRIQNNFRYHAQSVIASANSNENKIALVDIDILLRNKMLFFLKKTYPKNLIFLENDIKNLVKELKYEKVILLYKNRRLKKASLVAFGILFYFIKRCKEKSIFQKVKNKII